MRKLWATKREKKIQTLEERVWKRRVSIIPKTFGSCFYINKMKFGAIITTQDCHLNLNHLTDNICVCPHAEFNTCLMKSNTLLNFFFFSSLNQTKKNVEQCDWNAKRSLVVEVLK